MESYIVSLKRLPDNALLALLFFLFVILVCRCMHYKSNGCIHEFQEVDP